MSTSTVSLDNINYNDQDDNASEARYTSKKSLTDKFVINRFSLDYRLMKPKENL